MRWSHLFSKALWVPKLNSLCCTDIIIFCPIRHNQTVRGKKELLERQCFASSYELQSTLLMCQIHCTDAHSLNSFSEFISLSLSFFFSQRFSLTKAALLQLFGPYTAWTRALKANFSHLCHARVSRTASFLIGIDWSKGNSNFKPGFLRFYIWTRKGLMLFERIKREILWMFGEEKRALLGNVLHQVILATHINRVKLDVD